MLIQCVGTGRAITYSKQSCKTTEQEELLAKGLSVGGEGSTLQFLALGQGQQDQQPSIDLCVWILSVDSPDVYSSMNQITEMQTELSVLNLEPSEQLVLYDRHDPRWRPTIFIRLNENDGGLVARLGAGVYSLGLNCDENSMPTRKRMSVTLIRLHIYQTPWNPSGISEPRSSADAVKCPFIIKPTQLFHIKKIYLWQKIMKIKYLLSFNFLIPLPKDNHYKYFGKHI